MGCAAFTNIYDAPSTKIYGLKNASAQAKVHNYFINPNFSLAFSTSSFLKLGILRPMSQKQDGSAFKYFKPPITKVVIAISQTEKVQFPVFVEKDEDGFFVAECPVLKGCFTQGKTLDEALKNIAEVIEMCVEEEKEEILSLRQADISPEDFENLR